MPVLELSVPRQWKIAFIVGAVLTILVFSLAIWAT